MSNINIRKNNSKSGLAALALAAALNVAPMSGNQSYAWPVTSTPVQESFQGRGNYGGSEGISGIIYLFGGAGIVLGLFSACYNSGKK